MISAGTRSPVVPLLPAVVVLFALLVPAGAARAADDDLVRTPPDLSQRIREIRTIGILPPDLKLYELSSGGVKELRPDWCKDARESVQAALASELAKRGYDLKPLAPGPGADAELQDIRALYDAVVTGILRHAYAGPHFFPAKATNFDYTIGPIDNILRPGGADALLLVKGMDEISTSGRKAVQTLGVLAAAMAGVVATPRMGQTLVVFGLIDRSGDLLWFNFRVGAGGYNLRERESVSKLVAQAVERFPQEPREPSAGETGIATPANPGSKTGGEPAEPLDKKPPVGGN